MEEARGGIVFPVAPFETLPGRRLPGEGAVEMIKESKHHLHMFQALGGGGVEEGERLLFALSWKLI